MSVVSKERIVIDAVLDVKRVEITFGMNTIVRLTAAVHPFGEHIRNPLEVTMERLGGRETDDILLVADRMVREHLVKQRAKP